MKDVEAALFDFVHIFDEMNLDYAVLGGLAVRAYGVPRATYDVDVGVAIPDGRLAEFYDRVEDAGYTVPDSYRSGWVDRIADMPLVKFRIYRPDKSVDVDVFITETKFQQEIIRRRRATELDGQTFWIASPEDIVLLKLIAGRHRDYGDIEDMRLMLGDLDAEYMRPWADALGIRTELEAILSTPPL
jgi:hypothetical protein